MFQYELSLSQVLYNEGPLRRFYPKWLLDTTEENFMYREMSRPRLHAAGGTTLQLVTPDGVTLDAMFWRGASASFSDPVVIRCGPKRPFQALDLYWRSPESGGLRCKSRQSKNTIRSYSQYEAHNLDAAGDLERAALALGLGHLFRLLPACHHLHPFPPISVRFNFSKATSFQ